MVWPAGARDTDFWSDDFGLGSAETWEFSGVEGLQRLDGPQVVRAEPPELFEARLTRVQLDHVALEYFEATAHEAMRGPDQLAAFPTPLLTMVHLLDGELEIQLPEVSFPVRTGQSIVLDSRQPVDVSVLGEVRMLRSVVGIEHVPEALRREGATVPGPLGRSALASSFVAFIGTVLRSTRRNQQPHGPQLIAAVAELQSAVLAEAQQAALSSDGPAGLRYRIEEYIEQHHTDVRLDVTAIAAALGISVRHAHAVFNEGERTIGAVLRDRRVATASRRLRTVEGAVHLGRLAHESGFAERDTFTRAFHRRYGMSPAEYHAGGHRNHD